MRSDHDHHACDSVTKLQRALDCVALKMNLSKFSEMFDKKKTFRPKKKFQPGTMKYSLHKQAQASLNSGINLRQVIYTSKVSVICLATKYVNLNSEEFLQCFFISFWFIFLHTNGAGGFSYKSSWTLLEPFPQAILVVNSVKNYKLQTTN